MTNQTHPFIKKNRWLPIYAMIAFLSFFFIFLMVITNFQPLIQLEHQVTHVIQSYTGTPSMDYQHGIFTDMMMFLATYGDATPIVVLSCFFAGILFIKKYNFLAFWFLGVVATGGIIGVLLKFFVQRERPLGHLIEDDGFSFPSGHAIGSTLFFLILLFVFIPKIKYSLIRNLTTVLSLLIWVGILYSRLYFSAHHLGDVAAGVAFSTFWVLSAMWVYSISVSWFQNHLFKKSRI